MIGDARDFHYRKWTINCQAMLPLAGFGPEKGKSSSAKDKRYHHLSFYMLSDSLREGSPCQEVIPKTLKIPVKPKGRDQSETPLMRRKREGTTYSGEIAPCCWDLRDWSSWAKHPSPPLPSRSPKSDSLNPKNPMERKRIGNVGRRVEAENDKTLKLAVSHRRASKLDSQALTGVWRMRLVAGGWSDTSKSRTRLGRILGKFRPGSKRFQAWP